MAYPPYPLSLLPIIKHTKNLYASVIGLASRLVTCRPRPHLPGIHLSSLAIAATSHRCLNRDRGVALYCTTHHHGNCAAACAGCKETVGSRRDNVYVLPSTPPWLFIVCAPSQPVLTFPSVSDYPQYGRNRCVLSIDAVTHLTSSQSCPQSHKKVSTYGECLRSSSRLLLLRVTSTSTSCSCSGTASGGPVPAGWLLPIRSCD
jgi:hypothetical protein